MLLQNDICHLPGTAQFAYVIQCIRHSAGLSCDTQTSVGCVGANG